MKMQKIVEAVARIEPVVTSIERKLGVDLGAFVFDVVNANDQQLAGHLLDKPLLARELRDPWLNGDVGAGPGLGQLLANLAGAQGLARSLSWLEAVGVDLSLQRLKDSPVNPLTSSIYEAQPHGSIDTLKWFHERHGHDLFRAPVEGSKNVLALALGHNRIEAVVWMLQADDTLVDEPILSGDPVNPFSRSLTDYADVAIQGSSPLRDMIRKMVAARSARLALQEIDLEMAGPAP